MFYVPPYPSKEKAMGGELKRCPFCGKAAATAGKKATRFPWFKKVACSNDGCGAHFAYWHPDEWNRRADRRAQPAEAEGVEVVAFQVRRTAWGTTSNLYTEKLPFVPGEGVTQYSEPTALIRLSDHLAALSAERTRADVAVADANDAERELAAVTAERDAFREGRNCLIEENTLLYEQIADLIEERDQVRAEVERLRSVAREFAGFFSSDEPRHWELHALADGAALSAQGDDNAN